LLCKQGNYLFGSEDENRRFIETLREMQQQHIHMPISFRSSTDAAE